ncbi:hypothetical protein AB0395_36965 [Streptosporangium sp. NPDC051023]|uniref:hypothetical protein n=1 Tax=Streptosporangium sp. NPDC051023 TaxID=3155410 RepID=UPI00344BA831
MIDDPFGMMAHTGFDSADSPEIGDGARGTVIAFATIVTFFFLAFSVYTWVDSGDLAGSLAFGGTSLFCGGFTIVAAFFTLPGPASDRPPLARKPRSFAPRADGRARQRRPENRRAAVEASPHLARDGLGHDTARMRLYALGALPLRAVRWVLASNHRTWWPLGSLLALAAVNIHQSQGWGSAFYTLPSIVSFCVGVEWLRHRWGIEVKSRRSARDTGEDQTGPTAE